jgi:hypothetical protein
VDTSPGIYVPIVEDAQVSEASDAGNEARTQACLRCLTDEGLSCHAPYEACLANSQCAQMVECLTETDCWNASFSDLTNLPLCLTGCANDAGIHGGLDPGAPFIASLLNCSSTGDCMTACVGP